MIWLRSLIFNIAFYGWTAIICVFILWTLLLPPWFLKITGNFWSSVLIQIERYIGHITYEVVGQNFIPDGPCIIAAKHQSAWETFKLRVLFNDPAIVLKKELLSIPLWGWYMKHSGMIPIDRKGRTQAVSEMMRIARKAISDGRKIVIFPQGTRVAPGVHAPYKSGVVALYRELNLPIVPMALNSGMLWPRNSFIKKPGKITVEFLPSIPPGLPRQEMMQRLEKELEAASNRLMAT